MAQDSVRVRLTYPLERVHEPILYRLVTDYDLIPNIRRANIDPHSGGFIFLELQGAGTDIASALRFLDAVGVEVSPIGLDGSEEWAI
jgi:ABC-type methionine transport system ATPase subunit